jgi:small subunit ribosomal protein S2
MKLEIDIQELLNRGAYFGHRVARTNPRAVSYTYKAQNGIYLIDLFKTKADIEKALSALYESGTKEEGLLIVGTKRLIKAFLKELVDNTGIYSLSEKWVGGFLTNFEEISKNLKVTNQMVEDKEKGHWASMPKHESSKLDKKLNKYLKVYEGVLKMEKLPRNILIIDIKKERNALKEAQTIKPVYKIKYATNLCLYGVVDTNGDPTQLDFPMMMNDDSILALEYVLKSLVDAYVGGTKKAKKPELKK